MDTILAADGTTDCIVTGKGNDPVTADQFDVVDPKKGLPARILAVGCRP